MGPEASSHIEYLETRGHSHSHGMESNTSGASLKQYNETINSTFNRMKFEREKNSKFTVDRSMKPEYPVLKEPSVDVASNDLSTVNHSKQCNKSPVGANSPSNDSKTVKNHHLMQSLPTFSCLEPAINLNIYPTPLGHGSRKLTLSHRDFGSSPKNTFQNISSGNTPTNSNTLSIKTSNFDTSFCNANRSRSSSAINLKSNYSTAQTLKVRTNAYRFSYIYNSNNTLNRKIMINYFITYLMAKVYCVVVSNPTMNKFQKGSRAVKRPQKLTQHSITFLKLFYTLLFITLSTQSRHILVEAQRANEYSRNNQGPGSNFRPQYIDQSYTSTTARGGRESEGDIRLTGTRNEYSGNVEIFHVGRWGSICDDDWELRDATVACRQLGYPSARRATHDSEFGRATERYWLDNVNCQGNENFLHECTSNGWGLHDCSVAEAAGIECVPFPSSQSTSQYSQSSRAPSATSIFLRTTGVRRPTSSAASRGNLPNRDNFETDTPDAFAHIPTRRISNVLDRSRMRVRLAGGRSSTNEGRVEVDLFGNNRWGVVCGDGWMLMEANVTCTQLGLGFAKAAPQTHVYGGRRDNVVINGITCRGTERDLSQCDFKELSTTGSAVECPGGSNFAGVVCGTGLPDLVPDAELLRSTAYIEDRQMFFLRCAMEENCLARSAYALDQNDYMWPYLTRRLLRFTSRIVNLGTADFRPVLPKYLWEWHSCHMHYHSMDVFSHYDVTDRRGRRVAQGHKASFCLEDNECRRFSTHTYRCQNFGDQGISVGCSDVYEHNIDCQWVDITDVPPGYYIFKVTINPEFKVPELSFSNNAIRCDLLYTGLYVTVDNCTLGAP